MLTDSPWSDLSLVDFCKGLADDSTGAEGAPAARLLAATGAGLAAAAQRAGCTSESAVYANGRADELDALRERALARLETSRDVCEKLNRKPEGADLEKWCKRRVELVLETVELAVAALRISAVGAFDIEVEPAGDLAVAAGVLTAAAHATAAEVKRSVDAVSDTEWGERHRLAAGVLMEEASALLIEIQTETSKS
ncbi:MAG: formiminotetrahydrofolate cyclodeaminase [Planctomycetota bacterium]|jgi:formiminotetrahydrofolate cyclodeaminase